MAQFSVKSNRVKTQADEEKNLIRELDRIEDSIRSVRSNLGFKIAAEANIRGRLGDAAERVGSHISGMSSMHSALVNIVNDYERTERKIADGADTDDFQIKNTSGSGFTNGAGSEKDIIDDFINPLLEGIDDGEYRDYIIKRLESMKEFLAQIYNGNPAAIGTLLTIPELIKGDIDAFNDFVDNVKDKIVDMTGFDVDGRIDGAYYDKEISCENGSLGVSISAYEAYAGADGGVFTVDDDGNLVFNPHINAEIGASYTVLSAHGDYAVGDEMLGAAVSGSVIVGQVSAMASGSASLMDEDGNFNPHASVNASAEAILIDAKAQAGATVLGTEAKVEAGVNVGVGAHANIEVGDGKIDIDIGASLGVGASISVSLDFSGTIDAIQDGCESFFDSILPW